MKKILNSTNYANTHKPSRSSAHFMGQYISMVKVMDICVLKISGICEDQQLIERIASYAK